MFVLQKLKSYVFTNYGYSDQSVSAKGDVFDGDFICYQINNLDTLYQIIKFVENDKQKVEVIYRDNECCFTSCYNITNNKVTFTYFDNIKKHIIKFRYRNGKCYIRKITISYDLM